jgi:hypothetical protein
MFFSPTSISSIEEISSSRSSMSPSFSSSTSINESKSSYTTYYTEDSEDLKWMTPRQFAKELYTSKKIYFLLIGGIRAIRNRPSREETLFEKKSQVRDE